MIIRPDPSTAVTSSTLTPIKCGNCGTTDQLFLYSVGYRSGYRRVCTSCLLRLHPQHFCPSCFTVYPSPPPLLSAEYLSCIKCYSFSHIHCLGPADLSPYTCSICINPNSPIFVLKKVRDLTKSGGVFVDDVNDGEYRVIDRKDARILLAAAKIAAALMTKNAAEANVNAEKRAREAAASRKRARDALDHLAYLVAKEKFMMKEALLAGIQGPGSGRSFGVGKRENINVMNHTIRGVSLNANNCVAGVGRRENINVMNHTIRGVSLNANNGVAGRLNGSNGALAAVDLGDGQRRKEELNMGKLRLGVHLNDLVPMDVDLKPALMISQESNVLVSHGGSGGSANELICQEDTVNGLVGHCRSAVEIPGGFLVQNHGHEEVRVSDAQVMDVSMEDLLELNDDTQQKTGVEQSSQLNNQANGGPFGTE